MVDLAVLGERLDLMFLKVFSNLNDSMIVNTVCCIYLFARSVAA